MISSSSMEMYLFELQTIPSTKSRSNLNNTKLLIRFHKLVLFGNYFQIDFKKFSSLFKAMFLDFFAFLFSSYLFNKTWGGVISWIFLVLMLITCKETPGISPSLWKCYYYNVNPILAIRNDTLAYLKRSSFSFELSLSRSGYERVVTFELFNFKYANHWPVLESQIDDWVCKTLSEKFVRTVSIGRCFNKKKRSAYEFSS